MTTAGLCKQTLGDKACHPEPFASLKGKLREGSGSPDKEILRCAQDDSQWPMQGFVNSLLAGERRRGRFEEAASWSGRGFDT